jgi:predicted transcriptional regulator
MSTIPSEAKVGLLEKWGENSLLFGWTAVPVSLLLVQRKLSISPLGLNILMHLLSLWWEKRHLPYPSQSSIAEKIGVSARTVQREIVALKKGGLISVKKTSVHDEKYLGRNIYDLQPLVEKLGVLSSLLKEESLKKNKN